MIEGEIIGSIVGIEDGPIVGIFDGIDEGFIVGLMDGTQVGSLDGIVPENLTDDDFSIGESYYKK